MNAKEAIARAKEWVRDIYEEETIRNLGLEEVRFDDLAQNWLVTLGFSRPWDGARSPVGFLVDATSRSYKVVRIDDDNGAVISVEDRILKAA